MPASTLALGQASYELLEVLNDGSRSDIPANTARLRQQGSRVTLQASTRGGLIEDLGIQAEAATSLLITDRSSGLTYSDFDVLAGGPASVNADLNILANANNASLQLGAGDNRLNAARDLVDSEISATTGSDTVRIGGDADGTFVALGDGNDQFTANRGGTGLDVVMGAGDDTALFIGTLTAGANTQTPFVVENGQNLVDMGVGNDRATFINGIQGSVPGSSGYEIQLGAGNDTAVFGGKSTSEGFVLNTGTGSDQVVLGESTSNAVIDLGWDGQGPNGVVPPAGDLVVLGAGATLADSGIRSGQSNDTLRLAGTVIDTSLDLGWGSSMVEVDGSAELGFNGGDIAWDLGAGNDSLVFGELSDLSSGSGSGYINLGSGSDELSLLGTGNTGFSAIEFDLGNDGDSDTVVFGLGSSYSGFTISNFGQTDILFIGLGKYGYGYQFLNEAANEWDLETFQSIGNVIWRQNEDGGSVDQDLMTVAMDNFTPMSGDNAYTYSETTLEDETIKEYIDTHTLESLSTTESWTAAGDAPMSIDPPTAIFPDDTPA